MNIDLTQSQDVDGAYQSIDWSHIRTKYDDEGTKYAFNVLDGRIQAGYMIKLACLRHLRDLQRIGDEDFPYVYSMDKAQKILFFASMCPNVDTGEPTQLMPWQKFIFTQMIGWRTLKNAKRYSTVLISVSRGQGKTYLAAILMCYSYFIETIGLENQDFLVASINFKQTGKLFGYIKQMMKQLMVVEPFKTMAKQADLRIQNDQIIQKKFNNILRAISFESGQFDSFHFTTAIVDEVGELTSRDKTSKITSGQVKVKNRQFVQISTSYPNPTVPFHDDQSMIRSVMERDYVREADTYLGLVWSQDELSETFEPELWTKSNPLLDLPGERDNLLEGLINERDTHMLSGTIGDFQTKNLNLWLEESTDSYLKLADIERSIEHDFYIRGRDVYIGLDASLSSDNTAIGFVYPYMKNGQQRYHIEQFSFIPWQQAGSIEAKEKQDGINYRDLANKGFCTITSHEQGLINLDEVYQWLLDYVNDNQLNVLCFGYDAYSVTSLIQRLEVTNASWNLLPIRQISSYMTQATKFMQAGFVESSIDRKDDKILEKALVNARLKEDRAGVIVDKARATLKIDVVDAILDAFYQAMYHFESFSAVNDKSKQVERMTPEQIREWFTSDESGLI